MSLHVSDLTPIETTPVHTRFRRIVTPIPNLESIGFKLLFKFRPQG